MNGRRPSPPIGVALPTLIAWSILVVSLGLRVSQAAPATTEDTSLSTKLQELTRRVQVIQDVTGDFVEEKHTALLKVPLVSKGRVFVKGKRTRWQTTSPRRSVLYTDPSRVAIYYPLRETMEVYPIDQRLRSMVVSPIPRVESLRRHFDIGWVNRESSDSQSDSEATLLVLRLSPKEDSVAEIIAEITVVIDLRLGLATRVEMVDPDGDRTVLLFTNIRTNVGLSDGDVECDVPPSTKIIRPLGSGPPNAARSRSERP